jgi:hypothetical protein
MAFPVEQRLLMIANEMHRASRFCTEAATAHRQRAYERVLQLVDLTASSPIPDGLRRELLRWRDLVAERWLEGTADAARHQAALRVLLQLHPAAYAQLAAGLLSPGR